MKPPAALAEVVHVAKALGHPTRVRILAMLRHGPLCVCQLTAVLQTATSTTSGHLLELRRARLVVERRDGRWVEYRLSDDPDVMAVVAPVLAAAANDPLVRADRSALRAVQSVPVAVLCQADLDVAAARRARPGLTAGRRRRPSRRRAVGT